MNRLGPWLLASILALSGCAAKPTVEVSTPEPAVEAKYAHQVEPPERLGRSDLFLARVNRVANEQALQLNHRLYVGDEVDHALEVFTPPPRAYAVTTLPGNWSSTGLKASGWEAVDDGFGVVVKGGKVALALLKLERTNSRLYDQIASNFRDELGPATKKIIQNPSATETVSYQFWKQGVHLLMLEGDFGKGGRGTIAMSVGHQDLMAALRMTPDSAGQDLAEAKRLRDAK